MLVAAAKPTGALAENHVNLIDPVRTRRVQPEEKGIDRYRERVGCGALFLFCWEESTDAFSIYEFQNYLWRISSQRINAWFRDAPGDTGAALPGGGPAGGVR